LLAPDTNQGAEEKEGKKIPYLKIQKFQVETGLRMSY